MKKINYIWIIDDDPIQVFLAKRIMKNIEFSQNVLAMDNAERALNELQDLRGKKNSTLPDIIFVDINMPKMDGWHFLIEFDKITLERDVDIYFVTSSINPDDVQRAESIESLNGYLTKPIKKKDLEEIKKNFIAN